MRNILLIDNYDSFSFNLVEAFERLGCVVQTVRNSLSASQAFKIARNKNALIVLSPGPGRPEEAGCTLQLVALAKGRIPMIGFCLGHQAIAIEAGGLVTGAAKIIHGKSSLLHHDNAGPFVGLPSPLRVGRYHSLCVKDLPPSMHVHAELDGMAMAMSDSTAMQAGLQFHPESILTANGDRILANLLRGAGAVRP